MTKYCPKCGMELVDEAKFCKSCGASLENFQRAFDEDYVPPAVENSHTLAIVLGYVFAILMPIIGVIFGVYLYTRKDSSRAKRHSKFIIILAVVVWILSAISIFM